MDPRLHEAWFHYAAGLANEGFAHLHGGRPGEAAKAFAAAAKADPASLAAWAGLYESRMAEGDLAGAKESFLLLKGMAGDHAVERARMGQVLFERGLNRAAIALWREAAKDEAHAVPALVNIAVACQRLGAEDEAAQAAQEALVRHPRQATAHRILGQHAFAARDLDAALAHWRAVDPPDAQVLAHLGQTHMLLGDMEAALKDFQAAARLAPHYASSALMAMHYCASVTPDAIAQAHFAWGRQFPDRPRPPLRALRPDEPLRVGFISADFRHHATGIFLPPLLAARERALWQAHLYSNTLQADGFTERFRTLADSWTNIRPLDDAQAAARIQADAIDILIDLNGHSAGNRLGLFALRPAPIQITFMDYVGTTGLAAMDFLLHDAIQAPPAEDHRFTERVLRFPGDTLCFEPPAYAPNVAPPPFLGNGHLTFGAFNALAKMSDKTVALWSRILAQAPRTRMVLAAPSLKYKAAQERYRSLFVGHGIDADRLTLLGETDHANQLARHRLIDVMLDTTPYSGGLSTCESLWMGVPVITHLGDRIASRHAASHQIHCGLAEFVGESEQAYIDCALEFIADPSRLASLRATLRDRVAASPLIDNARYASEFFQILRKCQSRFSDENLPPDDEFC
ncbi:MAG: tetratricopeptide repeat protein [Rhodospirillales bacterium]|nr:tetratricopeptide repeat protein [Rhodospirillales bacterium]